MTGQNISAHRFGQRSERNPDQFQLFNEAELLAEHADEPIGNEITVPAHTRKRKKATHALPADLPRVEVVYELEASERHLSLIHI